MNRKLEEFNQKLRRSRVAVIGAGVSNLPLLSYLSELGVDVFLFDKNTYDNLSDEVKECVKKYNIVTYSWCLLLTGDTSRSRCETVNIHDISSGWP